MAITTPVIQLDDIVKTYRLRTGYRKVSTLNAVDGVSLQIQSGEIFGLLGLNGAGKTTLIKIMAGLLRADQGTGTVLGYDIDRDHKRIRASVSLVAPTADVGTDNNLTVRQNLEFWAVVYSLEASKRQQRIADLLEFLELTPYAEFWPMSISAGMRQRLAIARSLLVNNPIVFLDEPTVKLDGAGAEAVRRFIRQINTDFGITVILTTHFIYEAEQLCDRVAIMRKGKVVACDSVAQLRKHLQQYDTCRIQCGEVPASLRNQVADEITHALEIEHCTFEPGLLEVSARDLDAVLRYAVKCLREHHIDIRAVTTDEPSLEEVFVNTVMAQPGKGIAR